MPSFPVLPESGGFFIFRLRAGLPNGKTVPCFSRDTVERSVQMKIRSLALASLFALSVASVHAATITEDFSADPSSQGWQVFADTNLFQWNSASNNLAVT